MNRNNKKNMTNVIVKMIISAVIAGIIVLLLPASVAAFKLLIFNVLVIALFVIVGVVENKLRK